MWKNIIAPETVAFTWESFNIDKPKKKGWRIVIPAHFSIRFRRRDAAGDSLDWTAMRRGTTFVYVERKPCDDALGSDHTKDALSNTVEYLGSFELIRIKV
jgi:hypothetical protein